jgi:hypothetical protein
LLLSAVISWALLAGNGIAAPVGEPVQIVNSNAGRIMTAHADEYDHVVYIGGLAYRPSSPGIGAHVHAWGVDRNNKQVFFKTSSIYFNGKPSFNPTSSYVISVDPAVFNRAVKVFVTLHSAADAESRRPESH